MRSRIVRIFGAGCAAASLLTSSLWAQGLKQAVPQAPKVQAPAVPVQPQQPRVQQPAVPAQPQPRVQPPAAPVQPPAQPQPRVQTPAVPAQPQPKVQPPVNPLPQPNVPKVNPVNPNLPKTGTAPVAPKTNISPNVNPNIDPQIKVKADPKIDPKINQKVDPSIDPKIAPKLDSKATVNPRVNPDAKVGPNARIPGGLNHRPGDAIQHTTNSVTKTNQALGGNQINLGNRTIVLANRGYHPAYQRHQRYYNGYWAGNYGYGWGGPGGGWTYGAYGYRPLGWGLGAWGLGAIAYNSGYLGYYNPYYSNAGYAGGYNYAQPIAVAYDDTTPVAGAADNSGSADSILDSAVAAFRQNDYDQALDIVNKGISQYSTDAVLHEFRALVLFAKGDYQQSAATVHSVLAVGPGWNWETMRNFYSDVGIYTKQLRDLESFAKKNSDDAGSRFLLAYHYLAGGHQDAAARKLAEVVKLSPRDQVAADVLNMITAPAASATAAAAAPNNGREPQAGTPQPAIPQTTAKPPTAPRPADNPTPDAPPTAPDQAGTPAAKVDPAMLIGTWNASRDDGSKFELKLNDDKTFNWKFSQKDQKDQEFGGKYTIENNVLALQREDGGSLVAVVTPDGDKSFNFKLLGGPPQDPGLNFNH